MYLQVIVPISCLAAFICLAPTLRTSRGAPACFSREFFRRLSEEYSKLWRELGVLRFALVHLQLVFVGAFGFALEGSDRYAMPACKALIRLWTAIRVVGIGVVCQCALAACALIVDHQPAGAVIVEIWIGCAFGIFFVVLGSNSNRQRVTGLLSRLLGGRQSSFERAAAIAGLLGESPGRRDFEAHLGPNVETGTRGGAAAGVASETLSICVSVTDTGCGVPERAMEGLFERHKSESGIGIGLYLSSELAKLLGSELTVLSRCVEDAAGTDQEAANGAAAGSTRFEFVLDHVPVLADASGVLASGAEAFDGSAREPNTAAPSPASAPPSAVGTPAAQSAEPKAAMSAAAPTAAAAAAAAEVELPAGLRVLVLDDSRMNRMVMRNVLERQLKLDWKVTEAETAEEGLSLLIDQGEAFDIAIFDEDFGTGRMVGTEAIRRCRSAGLNALVIISCTGALVMVSADTILKQGADAVWSKPFPDWRNGDLQRSIATARAERLGKAPATGEATKHEPCVSVSRV
jgi:CheY-like chemotaxis protein